MPNGVGVSILIISGGQTSVGQDVKKNRMNIVTTNELMKLSGTITKHWTTITVRIKSTGFYFKLAW